MALNQQGITKQAREIHRSNLRKNIEYRLEVARAHGDTNLIKALENEANYIG
jgi:hypothetical protein